MIKSNIESNSQLKTLNIKVEHPEVKSLVWSLLFRWLMGLWRSLEGFNCRVKPSVYLLAPRVGDLASKGTQRTTEQKSRRNQYYSFLQPVDCFPLRILVKWTWSTFKGCIIVMMKYLVHKLNQSSFLSSMQKLQQFSTCIIQQSAKILGFHNYCENMSISVYEMGPVRVFSNMDLESIN